MQGRNRPCRGAQSASALSTNIRLATKRFRRRHAKAAAGKTGSCLSHTPYRGKSGGLMSLMGQGQTKSDVGVTSAFPLIADSKQACGMSVRCQKPMRQDKDMRLLEPIGLAPPSKAA
jgi:hypothetical protein